MSSFNPAIIEKLNGLSENVLSGHYIFNRDFIDSNYLAKRFSVPDKFPHNITYGLSTNPKHIQQYYKVREETYKEGVGANFHAGEDNYDSESHKILALAGNSCIGGIRITVSSPANHVILPTETSDFQFHDIYGKLDFDHLTYCEASRLALLPDFTYGEVRTELLNEATRFAIDELGVEIAFGRAANTHTRIFQTHYRSMGYELVIRRDIKPPSLGMDAPIVQIFAIDLTPDRRYTEIIKSYNQPAKTARELEFA